MYIPPFVCGVAATLLAEFLVGVVYVIVTDRKENDKEGDDNG